MVYVYSAWYIFILIINAIERLKTSSEEIGKYAMFVMGQQNYKCNALLLKIPIVFLMKTYKLILKLIWSSKGS